MPKSVVTYPELKSYIDKEIALSDWLTISQELIDQFAECTGDKQWIHVDRERAKRESPLRTTIAHGYLTLSLVAKLAVDSGAIPEDTQAAFNYGLDKVRFMSPVKSGANVRVRTFGMAVDDKGPGQFLVKNKHVMEIEGEEKPALIAESLVMLYERRKKQAAG